MHCSFDRESRTYKVRFEFKSLLSGFGANNTSQLEVKLTLWTRSPVADFYFYGAASGQHFGSQVNLQGRDASSEFSAQISPVAFPSVARSLSMGIVRIQKVESEW